MSQDAVPVSGLVVVDKVIRDAMDASAIGMCLVGPTGQLLRVNAAMCAMLGRDADTLLASSWQQLTHPEDVDTDQALVDEVLRGERDSYRLKKRYLRPDGQVVWGDLAVSCVRDDSGQVATFLSQIVDVTDLIRARERAEADEERRRAMLDSLLDPHVLLKAIRDADGQILDFEYIEANEAACRYVNLTRVQLIGTRLLDLLPRQVSSGMFSLYVDAVDGGGPLVLDDYVYPHEMFDSERRYDIRGVAVDDALSLTWRDVTARHEVAQRIAASELHYRLLAENSSGVVLHAKEGLIRWVSPSLTDVLGWSPDDWIGTALTDYLHPDDAPVVAAAAARLAAGERVHTRLRLLATDGEYHWVDSSAHRFTNEVGEADGIASSFSPADEAVAAEQVLHQRARLDELTGLLNRSEVFERLRTILGHPPRTGHELAIVFCDLDDFKEVNDTFGHRMGDFVLRSAARLTKEALRDGDLVARLGGDELLLVLTGVHDDASAAAVAENVRRHCATPQSYHHVDFTIQMSMGVTLVRRGEDIDDVIARADRAMYRAKRAGGRRVEVAPLPPLPAWPVATAPEPED